MNDDILKEYFSVVYENRGPSDIYLSERNGIWPKATYVAHRIKLYRNAEKLSYKYNNYSWFKKLFALKSRLIELNYEQINIQITRAITVLENIKY